MADLGGVPLEGVSRALALNDHFQQELYGHEVKGIPRKARAFRQRGRELLSTLGAWPWAHAERGRLLKGWRTSPEFLEPLHTWCATACAELEAELASSRPGIEATQGWIDSSPTRR